MKFRKAVFWLHLFCGFVSGIIVLIMSLTGVALTYQKQMTAWADKRLYNIQVPADPAPVSAEMILEKFQEARPEPGPITIAISSDPGMPASITSGLNEVTFVNPYTGEILGPGSHGMRTFFRIMTDWHRWLALSGENRGIGRAVTGACNSVFLFLVVSGLYLWWPAKWTTGILRALAWFRLGATGKARDSNWHYVFGFWCIVPLIFIVTSGVVISYSWASNLVFQLAGSEPPRGGLRGPGGPGGRPGMIPGMDRNRPPLQLDGLDALVSHVQKNAGDWKTISFQPSTVADKAAVFTVDKSLGGMPQLRSTLTLDKTSSEIVRSEKFEHMNTGLRARLWMRFVHTGEYYGIVGQTIAGIASVAGVILVWTGIALSFRRYSSWLRRRAEAK